MLNLKFSKPSDTSLITFEDAQKMSTELSMIDSDLFENFFWYVLVCWPRNSCKTTKHSAYYDEERLVMCIKKLKEMNNTRTGIRYFKNERQRRIQQHKPLFYLTSRTGFERVISDNQYQAQANIVQRLQGKISSQSSIAVILPRGTKLELRASYLRWNRGSTAHDVTFELAFTLGGPVTYNISIDDQQSERIKVYNDAGLRN